MNIPAPLAIRQAICCPAGQCVDPRNCQADAYAEKAAAVVRLLCERWKAQSWNVDRDRK